MDWYRIRPAQLLADIRIHGLSLEAQGLLVQLTAIVAHYDGVLSLDALFEDVRPVVSGRRREHLRAELLPVLATYIADVEAQAIAYADKSSKARAAINSRWQRARDTSVDTKVDTNVSMDVHTERKRERKNPPTPHEGELFAAFWAAYPRRIGKAKAEKAWRALGVTGAMLEAMLQALAWQTTSDAWTHGSGKFIPHPASWLNDRRWEDEPDGQAQKVLPVVDWDVA